jgi:rare lipoprotein A
LAVRPTRLRRLRIQRATHTSTLVVLVLLLVGFVRLGVEKHVTLVVGGRPESISTRSWNVQQLLVGEGIELTSSVQVVPPPATELANGMTVVVSPAPGAPIAAMGQPSAGVGVWVMDGVSDTEAIGSGELTEPSGSATGIGPSPVVFARVVVSGIWHDVATNASTAGELLAAMGIQPDANDRVHPSPGTPLYDGMSVRFDQVQVITQQLQRLIPFDIRTSYSQQLEPGAVQVLRSGVPGLARLAARVVKVNGRVTSRRVLNKVIRQPLAELLLSGPASAAGGTLGTGPHIQTGRATWYDPPWSGLTAAHPWLPFGTLVTVTDVATGRSVVVIINDRGPFAPDKIIDLSPEAFRILSPLGRGVIDVRLTW